MSVLRTEILQIFTNPTNMNCFKSDLLDLNRFAGFLAKRLIVILRQVLLIT